MYDRVPLRVLQENMAAWLLVLFYTITAIFFILIIAIPIPPAIANPLVFNFHRFKEGGVKLEGDASLLNSAIQFTADSRNPNKSYSYSVGRVTSYQHMQLWNETSRELTDFWTMFTFAIFPKEKRPTDGLAFFLADPNLPFLKHAEEGGGFGLVDGDQILNSTQHSFVAVEFDIFKNVWDPRGLHVGINFNSMNSSKFKQLPSPFEFAELPLILECSIEYSSATLNLGVSYNIQYKLLGALMANAYFSYEVDLRKYLPEQVIVGFSVATKQFSPKYFLRSWLLSSGLDSKPPTSTPSSTLPIVPSSLVTETKTKIRNSMLMGAVIGVVALVSIGFLCFLLWKCNKTEDNEEESLFDLNMDDEFQKGSGPKKFFHNDLVTATNKFSNAEKLGHGGFGDVYKGFLKDLNTEVAIKRISRDSKQGIKEYATEVKIISQLRHKNLVQLIGWCHKKKDLLLVYELMPNGSLDLHLHRGKSFLTWEVRYKIALDLASALFYLHEEWEQCVLHRDIKSSNIMLDSSFNAKLGDFGLARLVDHKKGSQTTVIAGTRGYIAPEYFITGKASKESDIYSFGVVLLEIASGRKAIDLKSEEETTIIEWVWDLYGLGKLLEVADPKLCGAFDEQKMECLVVLGIWCVHPDHSCRPSMKQVIQVLNFESPLPNLPQKMPVPTYLPPTTNAILF